MSDLERDLVDGMEEFAKKLKRGDLVEGTRMVICPTCKGLHPEWCSGCAGAGIVSRPTHWNDWDQPAGE